jgi:AP2-like factor (euAP2 lineage)
LISSSAVNNWLGSLDLQMETNVLGTGNPSLKRLLVTEERYSLWNDMYPAFFPNEVISLSSF